MLHPLIVDKDISSVLGREFPTQMDQCLSRIQSSELPMPALLINLLIKSLHELIPVYTTVGNVSSYISEKCQSVINDKIKFLPSGSMQGTL